MRCWLVGHLLDEVMVRAVQDAWWQEHHAPLPRFLDCDSESIVNGATVVQDLGEECGNGGRVHFETSLLVGTARELERMAVAIQIADVLVEEGEQTRDLACGPTLF